IDIIVFDHLSFAAVKAIDLAWNTIVGRGLQALATYVCYRVSTGTLLLIAERRSLSAETYAALAFSPTTFAAYGPTLRSLWRGKLDKRSKFALGWVLISVTYLLLVATMVDLMTGYQTGQATWLRTPNGTFINMQAGQSAAIQDMYIVPPPQNLTVLSKSVSPEWSFDNNEYVLSAITPSATNDCTGTMVYQTCLDSTKSAINYVNVTCAPGGGLGAPNLTNSITGFEMERMSGDLVTSYPDASCANLYSVGGAFVGTGGLAYQPSASFWEVPSSFLCVPSSDYRWGFSFQWLWMLTSINSIWLLVTAGLWLNVELRSHLLQKRGRFGTWRALLDLGGVAQSAVGYDAGAYTETELAAALAKLDDVAYCLREDGVTGAERIVLGPCVSSAARERFRLEWKTKYC
ncbi:hypothetical protein LTR22_027638, partial [Elasticomyces elasticus]